MSYQLLTHIHTLVPMTGGYNNPVPSLYNAAILIKDNVIVWVGNNDQWHIANDNLILPDHAPIPNALFSILNLKGHIVLPGLINTHHHLYQTLTRCIAQDNGLFNWLKTLYPIWLRLTGEAIHTSALTGMAELMLSGCTTASDHLYIYPNDAKIDDEIR
ncbi:MAG: amidohydrolase family protein, partial [Chloroflexota bacterium]